LRVNEFVIPRRITTDMAQSFSRADSQSITQTERRVRELSGLALAGFQEVRREGLGIALV
jgi:hypothetical protein